jgi:hypothetical protein
MIYWSRYLSLVEDAPYYTALEMEVHQWQAHFCNQLKKKITDAFVMSHVTNSIQLDMPCADPRVFYHVFFNSHSGGGGWVQLGPLCTSATDWPIVPTPGDHDDGEFGWMKISRGNRSTRRKTFPSATTKPTRPDTGSNPRRRGGKKATNRLSYGAACYNRMLPKFHVRPRVLHVIYMAKNRGEKTERDFKQTRHRQNKWNDLYV